MAVGARRSAYDTGLWFTEQMNRSHQLATTEGGLLRCLHEVAPSRGRSGSTTDIAEELPVDTTRFSMVAINRSAMCTRPTAMTTASSPRQDEEECALKAHQDRSSPLVATTNRLGRSCSFLQCCGKFFENVSSVLRVAEYD